MSHAASPRSKNAIEPAACEAKLVALRIIEAAAAAARSAMVVIVRDCRSSNAPCEQLNHAQANHQHRERHGIVIEPIPVVSTHGGSPHIAQGWH